MRARGIAGRHERREPGREDEDPLLAIDHGCLKLDGAEDDDDDDNDETTQNNVFILGAKDVDNWNFCGNLSSRKRSVSEYATSWCLCFVDLGIAER